MAFPTGYTKYQIITIDHTKVAADLTDYIVAVDLANLVKAGADVFDTCRSDGGDLRATKTDGTTELPIEIVAIDTTAKTGEVHIKFSGTLSSTTDTIIRLYYNGTDTLPAVTATYGRNNVWTAYKYVYHFQHTSGNATDSTAQGNTLTNTNTVGYSTSGKMGGSAADGGATNTNKYFVSSTMAVNLTTADSYVVQCWTKPTSSKNTQLINVNENNGNLAFYMTTRTADEQWLVRYNGTAAQFRTVSANYDDGNWHKMTMTVATTTLKYYYDGAQLGADLTVSSGSSGATEQLNVGGFPPYGNEYFTGLIDEVRIAQFSPSANWETTEHNNQSSPSTFYSVGDEQGGSSGPAKHLSFFNLVEKA